MNLTNFMTEQKCNESSSQCKADVTNVRRLVGYFYSDTAHSLSRKLLTDTEIEVLEKDLDFAPIQNRIYELTFSDFEELALRMRTK